MATFWPIARKKEGEGQKEGDEVCACGTIGEASGFPVEAVEFPRGAEGSWAKQRAEAQRWDRR